MEAIKIADVELRPAKTLDCRGMQCPAPILELSKAARGFGKQPVILEIIVDDEGFPSDLKAWCRASKHSVLSLVEETGLIVAHVGINLAAVEHAPESATRSVAARAQVAANDVAPARVVQPAAAPEHPERATVHAPSSHDVNCRGMQCPQPILTIAKKAQQLGKAGGMLHIVATDPDFPRDLKAWCNASKASLVSLYIERAQVNAVVAVGEAKDYVASKSTPRAEAVRVETPRAEVPRAEMRTIADDLSEAMALEASASLEPAHIAPRELVERAELISSAELIEPTAPLESAPIQAAAPIETAARVAVQTPAPLAVTPPQPEAGTALPSHIPVALTQFMSPELVPAVRENRCTLLVIKNDFESLMAAMMCASTAAAQGMETSVFFSFWGVNVLRAESPREDVPGGKVSFLQKVMKWMMPRGPKRQKMSKMHMAGMGKGMMQYFMRRNNVLSLEQLMLAAAEQNVKFIVCSMSMGIMGIEKRDIVDLPNVEFAGVSTFIELSRRSSMSLVF